MIVHTSSHLPCLRSELLGVADLGHNNQRQKIQYHLRLKQVWKCGGMCEGWEGGAVQPVAEGPVPPATEASGRGGGEGGGLADVVPLL